MSGEKLISKSIAFTGTLAEAYTSIEKRSPCITAVCEGTNLMYEVSLVIAAPNITKTPKTKGNMYRIF
jgi:hypothetical protein